MEKQTCRGCQEAEKRGTVMEFSFWLWGWIIISAGWVGTLAATHYMHYQSSPDDVLFVPLTNLLYGAGFLFITIGWIRSARNRRVYYSIDVDGKQHVHLFPPRHEVLAEPGRQHQYFDEQNRPLVGPILGIHPTMSRQVTVLAGDDVSGGNWYVRRGMDGMVEIRNSLMSGNHVTRLKLRAHSAICLLRTKLGECSMINALEERQQASAVVSKVGSSLAAISLWLDRSSNRTQSKIGEHCRLMAEAALSEVPADLLEKWRAEAPERLASLEVMTLGKHRHEKLKPSMTQAEAQSALGTAMRV